MELERAVLMMIIGFCFGFYIGQAVDLDLIIRDCQNFGVHLSANYKLTCEVKK